MLTVRHPGIGRLRTRDGITHLTVCTVMSIGLVPGVSGCAARRVYVSGGLNSCQAHPDVKWIFQSADRIATGFLPFISRASFDNPGLYGDRLVLQSPNLGCICQTSNELYVIDANKGHLVLWVSKSSWHRFDYIVVGRKLLVEVDDSTVRECYDLASGWPVAAPELLYRERSRL